MEIDECRDVTWKQVQEAVAAGASLDVFLPRDCIARPLTGHHEQIATVEVDNDLHTHAACPQPAAPIDTQKQSAIRPWQKSRWAVIGQLRARLSEEAAWGATPDAQRSRQLLAPELAAAAQGLCTADWTGVFALPLHSRPALQEPPLPMHPRAPLPSGCTQWLALLRAVDSAALCTYILCDALPALSRMQADTGQVSAESSRRHLRQVVGHCFARMKLAELDPAQMHSLLQALLTDLSSPFGHSLNAELRLRYFAATMVWI